MHKVFISLYAFIGFMGISKAEVFLSAEVPDPEGVSVIDVKSGQQTSLLLNFSEESSQKITNHLKIDMDAPEQLRAHSPHFSCSDKDYDSDPVPHTCSAFLWKDGSMSISPSLNENSFIGQGRINDTGTTRLFRDGLIFENRAVLLAISEKAADTIFDFLVDAKRITNKDKSVVRNGEDIACVRRPLIKRTKTECWIKEPTVYQRAMQ